MGHDEEPAPRPEDDPSRRADGAARSPGSAGGKRSLPSGIGHDTTRGRPPGFFITPDTAPPGLSVPRPRWVTPAFLALFAASAAALDRWIPVLTHLYGRFLRAAADVPADTFGKQTSVAVRPLVLLLALLFALLAAGTVRRRLRLFGATVLAFGVLVTLTDLALTRLSMYGGPGPFGALGNTIAGLDGIVALAIGVFTCAALPPGVVVRAERRRPHRDIALLGIVVMVAVLTVLLVKRHWGELLLLLSKAPLLGGIASALVVFFGLFPGMLYALNITRRCTNRGKHTMLFPVGIVVPARNEEGLIGDCIRAIDEAVAGYPEQCTVM